MNKQQRAPIGIMLAIECWILALLLLAEPVRSALSVSSGGAIQIWSWLFLIVAIWSLASWRYWVGPLFMPFPIFLCAAIAFNGGQLILQVFYLNRDGPIPMGEFDSQLIARAAQYVSFGILAFHAGGIVAGLSKPVPVVDVSSQDKESAILLGMRVVGISIAIVGGIFLIRTKAEQLRIVLQGNYLDLYRQEVGVGAAAAGTIIAAALVPGLIFALVGFREQIGAQRLIILLFAVVALTDLFLGYRAHAVWPVVALLWVIHTLGRGLPRATVIAGSGLLIFVVFPIVRLAREVQSSHRWSFSSLKQLYGQIDSPLTATLSEMGGSMSTVAYTLELVPSVRGFDYGLGYFYALTAVIPNVFGDGAHPLARHGLPSVWLVTETQPEVARSGGGLGFSFLAEAYLNFGLVPSFIALIVMGFIFSYGFSRLLAGGGDLGIACAGIVLSFLPLYARGELYIVIRSVAWYVIIPSVAVIIVAASARERRVRLRSRQDTVWKRTRIYKNY